MEYAYSSPQQAHILSLLNFVANQELVCDQNGG
jgi:hypothetical protein